MNGKTYIFTDNEEISNKLLVYMAKCGGDYEDNYDILDFTDVTEGNKYTYKGKTVYIIHSDTVAGVNLINIIKTVVYKYIIVPPETINELISIENIQKKGCNKVEFEKVLNNGNCFLAPWIKYNEKNKEVVKHAILKDYVINEYHLKADDSTGERKLYRYDNGVYKEISKEPLRQLILEYLPNSAQSDYNIEQTYKLTRTAAEAFDIFKCDTDENIINVENGLLDVMSKELKPHTPEYLSTFQLKVKYNAAPDNGKLWDNYLNSLCTTKDGTIDHEEINVLQELFGAALSNISGSSLKKFFLLYSAVGDTGKTRYLKVLCSFVPSDKVTSIFIQNLAEKHTTSGLVGKRLNIVDDQSTASIKDSSILKSLTGDGVIPVNYKGGAVTNFEYKGYIIAACNGLPIPEDDKGNHMFSRYFILPFENSIPIEKRITDIAEQIIEKEKEYVFLWALEGLRRFIKNGRRFTECKRSKEVTEDLRLKADSVHRFIAEKCTITGNTKDRIKCTEVYNQYEKYMQAQGEKNKVDIKNFPQRMAKLGILKKRRGDTNYYVGLIDGKIEKIEHSSNIISMFNT